MESASLEKQISKVNMKLLVTVKIEISFLFRAEAKGWISIQIKSMLYKI